MEHRVQIRLDDARYRKVADEAKRRGTSMAAIIRDAIDRAGSDEQQRRQRALASILGAAPMPVWDDPADLRAKLDAEHERHRG